jgi:uncharacterized protein (TIGR02466 family)
MPTQAQVHALFPTPVGSYSGFELQEELQHFLLNLVQTSQARPNSKDPRLSHYFDSVGQGVLALEDPLLQALQSWILAAGLDFVRRVQGYQCEELQVISSWLNLAEAGGGQPPHSHENSWISGTYYVCFESGHAPIRFWRPGSQSQPNRPYLSLMRTEHHTAFSSDEVAISPSAGTLLLWPSQLLHGHSGNALDGRLSLSLNMLPTRLFGSSYGLALAPFVSKPSGKYRSVE